MTIERVESGQPFKPSSSDWNTLADMANARLIEKSIALQHTRVDDGLVVVGVRNTTDAALGLYQIVKLANPLTPPSTDEAINNVYFNEMIFDGKVPAFPDDMGRLAILLDYCAVNQVVPACVAGCVHVDVDVTQEWHKYADVNNDAQTSLKSCVQGSCEIIWKESGTGVKRAIVRIGRVGTPVIDVVAQADLDYGTSAGCVIYRGGGATTDQVMVHHKHAAPDIDFSSGDKFSAVWNDDVQEWHVIPFGGSGGGGTDAQAIVKVTGAACLVSTPNAGCTYSGVLVGLGQAPDFCGDPWVDGGAIWIADLNQCFRTGSVVGSEIYIGRKLIDDFVPYGGAAARPLYVIRGSAADKIAVIRVVANTGQACKETPTVSLSECIWTAKLQVVDTSGAGLCGPYTDGTDVFASLIPICSPTVVLKNELYLAIRLGSFHSSSLDVTRDAYGIIGSPKPLCEALQDFNGYVAVKRQILAHAVGTTETPGVCQWTTLCEEQFSLPTLNTSLNSQVELVANVLEGSTLFCGTVSLCDILVTTPGWQQSPYVFLAGDCTFTSLCTAITSICEDIDPMDEELILTAIRIKCMPDGSMQIAGVQDPALWDNYDPLKRQFLAHKESTSFGCGGVGFFEWVDEEICPTSPGGP